MNHLIKRVICAILALTITLSCIWIANEVLILKRADGITTIKDFYAQEENTVDVLLLGSSHSGMNLDASTFWSEYGISSYALWGSIQPFWNTYHFLVEALKTQTPKVVVLDTYAAVRTEEYSDDARQVTNVSGMKLSWNKIKAIQVSAPKERWFNLLFGFPIYHQRYSELTRNDFAHFPWSEEQVNNKGTGFRYGEKDFPLEDASAVTEVGQIFPKQEEYLRKIILLCKEKEIPLVLITTPTVPRISEQPYYNAVAQLAQECSVPYYNFNLMDSEIGFETRYYWTDGAHLNTEGARVLSKYLARVLVENYELEDHRGDERYSSWQAHAVNTQNSYIRKINDAEDYFKELSKTDRMVFLIKNSAWDTSENYEKLVRQLENIGVDYDKMMAPKGGDWLIPHTVNGEFINQYFGDLYSEFTFDNKLFAVDFSSDAGVSIDGKTIYNLHAPGIVCVVYDKETHSCVDIVEFLALNSFSLNHVPVP